MSNQAHPDWATQATDALDRIVGVVRDRAVGPALTIARAVVYGTLAAIVGAVGAVLFAVAAVRFLDVYIPGDVWIPYTIVGGIFFLAGVLAFPRRKAQQEES
jgi:hypothetical protein